MINGTCIKASDRVLSIRLELEASCLDVDSIHVALCEVVVNKQPSFK